VGDIDGDPVGRKVGTAVGKADGDSFGESVGGGTRRRPEQARRLAVLVRSPVIMFCVASFNIAVVTASGDMAVESPAAAWRYRAAKPAI